MGRTERNDICQHRSSRRCCASTAESVSFSRAGQTTHVVDTHTPLTRYSLFARHIRISICWCAQRCVLRRLRHLLTSGESFFRRAATTSTTPTTTSYAAKCIVHWHSDVCVSTDRSAVCSFQNSNRRCSRLVARRHCSERCLKAWPETCFARHSLSIAVGRWRA
jgi:hypothetical protein